MASLQTVSLLVRDFDEARDYFVDALGFEVIEDTRLSATKRWLVVKPANSPTGATGLLLAEPSSPAQAERIGKQGEDRVMFFLGTDDFTRDYTRMRAHGVRFIEEPRHEPYGTVVVFEDLYGNKWDLIEKA